MQAHRSMEKPGSLMAVFNVNTDPRKPVYITETDNMVINCRISTSVTVSQGLPSDYASHTLPLEPH